MSGRLFATPECKAWWRDVNAHDRAAAALTQAGSKEVWMSNIKCRNGNCGAVLPAVYIGDRGVATQKVERIVISGKVEYRLSQETRVTAKRADVHCPVCGNLNRVYPAATNWRP